MNLKIHHLLMNEVIFWLFASIFNSQSDFQYILACPGRVLIFL